MNIKNLSKRVISLLLVLTLILSLVALTGCGEEESSSSEFENPLDAPNLETSTGIPGEQPEAPDASMTEEDEKEIAETKMADLNAASVEAAMSMIAGTARSMGITVAED